MNERIKTLFKNPGFLISIILFIVPFFWMRPGEANMGGDGGSLYYYDPLNFIKNYIIYKIYPFGTGPVEVRSFYLPFASILAGFNLFFSSGYLVSVLHTSIKVSLGFLSIYLIMKELLNYLKEKVKPEKIHNFNILEIVAIVSGFFYIFSPIITRDDRFINPIPSHDQVFLNPLLFYLVLRYCVTNKIKYLWALLFTTLIFAHSFSYSAVPALFSFYPLAFLFLVVYITQILKKKLPVMGIIIGIVFFILLHLFHLGPLIVQIFDPLSDTNTRVFNADDRIATVTTFYGVIGFASLPGSLLLSPLSGGGWQFFSFLAPLIVLLGLVNNKIKSKLFLLTGISFLIILYLVSAKVSYSGIKIYENLFLHVPGFGMFRWFYIQWMFVYVFFFSLLFGQALFLVLNTLNTTKVKVILFFFFVYIIGSAWVFIRGDQFALAHFQSDNVKRMVAMDSRYESMLEYIRQIPYDGKILHFPFSDFNFQVLHGANDGAYVGTSTIGQLTGTKDFAGYWNTAPYSEAFLQFAKEKNYKGLKRIISLLNIRYIFYNADKKTYDTTFPGRPFEYVRNFLPPNQKEYGEFIEPLIGEKMFEDGPYKLFSVTEDSFLPHIYIPKETIIYTYNSKHDRYYNAASSFLLDDPLSTSVEKNPQQRIAFIEKDECVNKLLDNSFCVSNMSFEKIPTVYFKKINPIQYSVKVTNVEKPFLLVFSDAFHRDWKLFKSKNSPQEDRMKTYFNQDITEGKLQDIFFDKKTFDSLFLNSISESQHLTANAYANAWYLTPQDVEEGQASFTIEMVGQRLFYVTFLISFLSFCVLVLWGIMLVVKKKF